MTEFAVQPAFVKPQRAIYDENDLEEFKKSQFLKDFTKFIQLLSDSVVGIKVSDTSYTVCDPIEKFERFMQSLHDLVDEIPPIQQPMRFGNKAFRDWHARLGERANEFLDTLLPEDMIIRGAKTELVPYLQMSFGNETRIDYGTGHEMSIAVFFFCLFKLRVIAATDFTAVVLRGFVAYINCMRRLQKEYMLEPAGSHGVWGLDDYHCLTFVWGSAQLRNHPTVTPSSIHDNDLLKSSAADYLYLEGIKFIKGIKSCAPFAETSPMLNDISGLADWNKVHTGLLRLFQGEVLFKFPVVQHTLFGTLVPCEWKDLSDPSSHRATGGGRQTSPREGVTNLSAVPHVSGQPSMQTTSRPTAVPVMGAHDPMVATRAPWATQGAGMVPGRQLGVGVPGRQLEVGTGIATEIGATRRHETGETNRAPSGSTFDPSVHTQAPWARK
jgi:hypothetical protein